MTDLQRKLGAKDAIPPFIVETSCVTFWPSLRGIVESFRAGLSKLVSECFCAGFINSQLRPCSALGGVTVCF